MGSPAIFAGKRSKLLSSKGLLYSNGSINDYNGDINYILNGHAEVNTTGWATYADAAQSTPVDGTGGSPSVTWTQTTTSPLDDLGSFVFTKDAVNRQGQGVSYAFTIDSASQAKVMTITCDYIVGSGTFTAGSRTTDSDLEVYIYDVTNSVLIQPSTYKFYSNSSTVASQFIANFQTPYNSTSYRLIFHCATTSASAYTVKFDNVKVSPTEYTYGTPITDWTSFSMTIGGTTSAPTRGTTTSEKAYCRRVGRNMEIMYSLQMSAAGSAGSGAYLFSIPTGYTIDTTQVTLSTGAGATAIGTVGSMVGTGTYATTSAGNTAFSGILNAFAYSTSQVYFTSNATIAGPYPTMYPVGSSNTIFSSASNFTFNISVPITGWSSCVQMSDSTTQQVVTASASIAASASTTTNQPINFATVQFDTVNGITTGASWKYTAQIAGYYRVTLVMDTNVASNYLLYKNGVSQGYIASQAVSVYGSGSRIILLNSGDYVDCRPDTGSATVQAASYISIDRLSGPASIAATDTVAASYWLSANFAASTTVPINFDSKEFDYQGSVTTSATAWKFTAPVAGLYAIQGSLGAAGVIVNFLIYKNGSSYKNIGGGPIAQNGNATSTIRLLAGEYIDIRPSASTTISGGSLSANGVSNISITKIGNY